jgi:hypothetical protein
MTLMNNKKSESMRSALVVMLRRCADYLAALSPEEIDAFLDGELELRFSVVAKKGRAKKKKPSSLDAEQLANVAGRLRQMDNRANGEQLLHEVAPTRATLEALARHLDVAVRRDDSQDDLIRRIIESTIGFRLSTAAIQGRPVGRSRDELVDAIVDPAKK